MITTNRRGCRSHSSILHFQLKLESIETIKRGNMKAWIKKVYGTEKPVIGSRVDVPPSNVALTVMLGLAE
jgi:hypothetical protein